MLLAVLSITGFGLRGFIKLFLQKPLDNKLWKILPHINDTLLLAAAIGLLVMYQWNPFEISWVLAKLIALVVYIGLGVVALRAGKTLMQQRIAFFSAFIVFSYIAATAVTKQPFWFLG
jgi:uncharacterized membrane protein SirB2